VLTIGVCTAAGILETVIDNPAFAAALIAVVVFRVEIVIVFGRVSEMVEKVAGLFFVRHDDISRLSSAALSPISGNISSQKQAGTPSSNSPYSQRQQTGQAPQTSHRLT
jgi:hypothetical protein